MLVYVGIIFALSIVSRDGARTFVPSVFPAGAKPVFGFALNNPGLSRAMEAQKKHQQKLLDIPGVVGVGTGIGANGQPAIRVFTKRAGIPGIPEGLEEVPVETKVTGMFIAYSDPTDRFDRPVPIGVSTGHPDITAGTLGCRVKDGNGNVYALSNNHVYANINDAIIGEDVIQPGTYDGGVDPDSVPVDVIGQLCDFEPIDFSLFGSNAIDAAIVCTTTDMVGNATPLDGYGRPNSTIFGDSDSDGVFDNLNALLLQPVQKFGRTTGLTNGKVTEINVTSAVCYANCSTPFYAQFAWFNNQIAIESVNSNAFSMGGDSGSLIVTDDDNKNPVGLLFAGSSTITLANRIDLVLNRFDVSIDGLQSTTPSNELCNNGVDDDGDGDVDCVDLDCQAQCASLYCFKGVMDGICNPKKDGELCPDCLGATEPSSEICGNGKDDDRDGRADCSDPDCFDDSSCTTGACLSKGFFCRSDDECCSGLCRGIKCK